MSTTFTELTEYEFFRNSEAGVSELIGWDLDRIRLVRYKFTSPVGGANHIAISKDRIKVRNGKPIGLKFFISTSPDLYLTLPTDYASVGWELPSEKSGDSYTFTGAVDVVLLPNTDYYLYIFPGEFADSSNYWWDYWKTITVELSGAAGLVRIKVGGTELLTTPIVKNGDSFVQLAATIKNGDSLTYCV